jgi:hypothetical protein
MGNEISKVADKVGGAIGGVVNDAVNGIEDAANAVKDGVEDVVDSIEDAGDAVGSSVADFFFPDNPKMRERCFQLERDIKNFDTDFGALKKELYVHP